MANYAYQVREPGGASVTGVIRAETVIEASRALKTGGRIVINLHERDEAAAPAPQARRRRVRLDEVVYLTNQLAVMVDTGVPLTEALDAVHEQTAHAGLKIMLKDVADQVKSGALFSASLARHPECFDGLYVNMIRAAEASGTLGSTLERMCQYLRNEREIQKQVRGAMIYPCVLLTCCVLVVASVMTFVLPRFEQIYAGKSAVLPAPTRVLLGISGFMLRNWALLLVVATAAVTAMRIGARLPRGQLFLDRLRLRLPIVGPMYHKVYLSRSLRTLASMLSSGVGMLEALEIASAVVGNGMYRRLWAGIAERLTTGRTFTDELLAQPMIPRSVTQMVASGEKTGRLANVMNRVSEFCESDLRVGVKAMTTLIEPLMVIVMGLLVGGIAVALLLPIFSISRVIAR